MRVIVMGGADEIEGTVPEGTDFDDRFIVTTDEGERFVVNGWNCTIKVV